MTTFCQSENIIVLIGKDAKGTGVVWGEGGRKRKNSKFTSLFHQVKVKCQTERNAEIKFDKGTSKIKINLFFSWKPSVFGTVFAHEPGFKTENLLKYRIHNSTAIVERMFLGKHDVDIDQI